ncbi:MAG: cupin domain-containing protein [Solirubrobacteraceae bacterium]
MDGEVIVASVREPSTVYGVHGSDGASYWKCFARGSVLHSDLEAWEYAALPAGSVSGEHEHSRTDEVYFILTGEGEMSLNGQRRRVVPGDAILTPLGARHGLVNTGEGVLSWLTIEMTHPATIDLLPDWSPVGIAAEE